MDVCGGTQNLKYPWQMIDNAQLLEHLAAGLEGDSNFMAWALARFRVVEHLATPSALGERLGLSRPLLTRLSLCKRPRPDEQDFAARVHEVAEFTALDPAILATVLRQVEFLEHLQSVRPAAGENVIQFPGAVSHPPLLAAARDRDDSEKGASPPTIR